MVGLFWAANQLDINSIFLINGHFHLSSTIYYMNCTGQSTLRLGWCCRYQPDTKLAVSHSDSQPAWGDFVKLNISAILLPSLNITSLGSKSQGETNTSIDYWLGLNLNLMIIIIMVIPLSGTTWDCRIMIINVQFMDWLSKISACLTSCSILYSWKSVRKFTIIVDLWPKNAVVLILLLITF